MNLKNRRKLRRELKARGLLTEFKQEMKKFGNDFNMKNILSLGGAFDFGKSRRGTEFWCDLTNILPNELGWRYE